MCKFIGQSDVKIHYDVTDKNNNTSSEGLDRYEHKYPSSSYRLAAMLAIMFVSTLTFKIAVILYFLYTEEKNKTSLFKSLYSCSLFKIRYFLLTRFYLTNSEWVDYGVLCHFQQYFSYIVAVLLVEETGVPGENHRPAASH